MSPVEYLREFINERLTAAAEEIFGVFEKAIVEYEEEIDRQRRLLDNVWKPVLHETEFPQHNVCKEEEFLCEQQLCIQEKSSSLDQEAPEHPRIKEEQEEPCTSQEGDQLELMLTPIYENSDFGEGLPQQHVCKEEEEEEYLREQQLCIQERSSSLGQEDPEPPHIKEEQEHEMLTPSCENETHRKQEIPRGCISVESAAVPEPNKDHEAEIQDQKRDKHREGPYSCITCGMIFSQLSTLIPHIKSHMGENPYLCNKCGKRFSSTSTLNTHMRIHTGEKPYSCNTCGKRFCWTSQLKAHKKVHTGEKS